MGCSAHRCDTAPPGTRWGSVLATLWGAAINLRRADIAAVCGCYDIAYKHERSAQEALEASAGAIRARHRVLS